MNPILQFHAGGTATWLRLRWERREDLTRLRAVGKHLPKSPRRESAGAVLVKYSAY